MNLRQNQKGFTIVELLIVVVVIAILAAISIVAYTGITNRANRSAAMEAANAVKSVATTYNGANSAWPTSRADFVSGGADPIAKLPSDICFSDAVIVNGTAPLSNNCNGTAPVVDGNGPKTVSVQRLGAGGTLPVTGFRITYYDYVDDTAKTMDVGTGTVLSSGALMPN